ncbi:MAG: S8 family serine peptidase, partial [Promethearchaeota archaeon]
NLQDIGINGTGIKIAILDTGIDKNHPDLDDIDNNDLTNDPKVILEESFIDYDEDGITDIGATDDGGHGTHVAGIAAGAGYLRGVAPGAMLMNGKVLDAVIGGYSSWIVKGIDWAVANNASIISMSLGGGPGDVSPLINTAVDAAWENGVMVVIAAGNDGPKPGTVSSPGLASRAITVGASNVYNDVSFFSGRGPSTTGVVDPDVLAPGRGILSTFIGGSYEVYSGTSMAAPAVAGVAALLLSAVPGVDIDSVRSAILSTATPINRHVYDQGMGLVNATAAFQWLQDPSMFAYPSFTTSSPLILSSGEIFEYQLDVFLNQSYNSLAFSPSPEVESYVNISILDQDDEGWVRTKIRVQMPSTITSGNILIKNGTNIYFEADLVLQPDINENDGGTGTDAGETFAGALPLNIGTLITGEVHQWDNDIYSFPAIKDLEYAVELKNLTGNLNIQVTDENGTVFVRGTQPGYVPEKVLFVAPSSGNYFIRIVDSSPGSYSLLVREASLGELSLFTPADLTGKMESSTIDLDSNGLFDLLEFSVEVNVSEAGKYDFLYSIAQKRPQYHYGLFVFMWDWLNLTLDEGVQNLTISVPGGLLESSGFTGSYIINDLVIGKSEFSLLLNFSTEVASTQVYDYKLFEPLDNRLNSFRLIEEDSDDNGKPERILVELEFEFTNFGIFEVGIPIVNENQNELLAFNTEEIIVFLPGLVKTTIEIPAQQFENQGNIMLYGVALAGNRYLIPVYALLSQENFASFEPLVVVSITDHAIDSNENGENDSIRFILTITSKIETDAIIFTGHPFSYPNETMIFVNSSSEKVPINLGTQIAGLNFDARILRAKNLAGPFFFPNFGIRFEEYEFTANFLYVTKEYTSVDFEYPVAWFSKFLGSTVQNSSVNAGLDVTWEVTATTPENVIFDLEIHRYEPIQGSFTKTMNFTKNITPGVVNITFHVEAADLFHTEYIGGLEIYYASIYLLNSQEGLKHRFQEHNYTLVDFVFHAGRLTSIDYQDYTNSVDAFFVCPPEIELQRTDANDKFDGLLINTTIGFNKNGTYELEVNLFSENDYETRKIRNSTTFNVNELSSHSFTFFFSAKTIIRNGFDKTIYGNISIINIDTINMTVLKIPHFLINASTFNYEPPMNTPLIVSDAALDTNFDGKYDSIELTFRVDVTIEGEYGFAAGIYSQLRNFREYYLGNVTIPSTT